MHYNCFGTPALEFTGVFWCMLLLFFHIYKPLSDCMVRTEAPHLLIMHRRVSK